MFLNYQYLESTEYQVSSFKFQVLLAISAIHKPLAMNNTHRMRCTQIEIVTNTNRHMTSTYYTKQNNYIIDYII